MKLWFAVVCTGIAVAVGGVYFLAAVAPIAAAPYLSGAAIFFTGLGSKVVLDRWRQATGADSPDGLERAVAMRAQSRSFLDLVLLQLTACLVVLVFPVPPGAVMAAVLLLGVADFWIRYAVALRLRGRAA
ncbi:hypothetical protein [Rathayibacter toxicus]|uniref:hypothetical protein n=1 Tax=Rathayibacter toxicus TaxID=145458 RepID=UPI001C05AE55|nr:hypothetical protein [Rathayibacter toxicus]QWL31173.1 hypothetical protein E2R34_10755 [Rathayibacter toxicus]